MKIIITGTSRGIGLELTRQALKSDHQVLAVARNPQASKELQALETSYPDQLKLLAADVTNPKDLEQIANVASGWGSVDIVINNAGIYKKGISESDFTESFRTNTIAPFLLTKTLLPLLKKGHEPKVVQISSQMGSIKDNTSGGSVAYRASKAALNAVNKSLSIDEPWLTSVVLHPGWVQTDMGGEGAAVSVPDSATGIWKVIGKNSTELQGRFYNYKGEELAW